MNTFEMKTAIHFGDNALDRLKEIPYKRVLIITDPFVVQSKMINLITAPLNSAGIEYDIFHDVVPDAPVDKIAEGVKKFLEYQPEAVVAVGGGSAIDSSKAIREFALKINNYGKVGLIAIPTTSGTGSEVTSFAVVNDTAAHVKYPLISESLTADEAILDAELVRSVPPAITADTGMDVFTHALESYVSIKDIEEVDGKNLAAALGIGVDAAYNTGGIPWLRIPSSPSFPWSIRSVSDGKSSRSFSRRGRIPSHRQSLNLPATAPRSRKTSSRWRERKSPSAAA